MTAILPGATIGILGGGQLGRMTGMAARSLGYDVHVLDPDAACPASVIASRVVAASFDDADAAADLARGCDVVTLEIEQIARASLDAAARHAPVRPGAEAVYVIQDRARQKAWLAGHGFPLGAYRAVESAEQLVEAATALGACVAKTTTGGYDGRGQRRIATASEAAAAWSTLGARPLVVERWLPIAAELSVLVARGSDGATVVYPPSMNVHREGVLFSAVLPAPVDDELAGRAMALGLSVARALEIVGLLAIELFVTEAGELLINELAPRPHNTFHGTERACLTSQFEQLVRAVCGLPLGDPGAVAPAAIVNLLGDLWLDGRSPAWPRALSDSTVRLHLYGKRAARAGRKMGHLSAVAATPSAALDAALGAYARLA